MSWNKVKSWFGGVKDRIAAALDRLPDPSALYAERKRYAAALLALGDGVRDFSAVDYAIIEYVALAVRIAEFASPAAGAGNEKLAAVAERVRSAWDKLARVEDVYDAWWTKIGRPFIAAYVDESNQHGWVKP